jgi:hypothetical protein
MIRVDPRDPLEINFFHAEYAEIAEAMLNRNAHKCGEYAEAHATLAPPSGWQAQTTCVRFREFCAFRVSFFYQTVISFFSNHG